jgi:hypothetical protein
LDTDPVKNWSFNTCAIAGFAGSGLAVALIIVNLLTHNAYLTVLLPVAGAALLVGGLLSLRAHVLWIRGNTRSGLR